MLFYLTFGLFVAIYSVRAEIVSTENSEVSSTPSTPTDDPDAKRDVMQMIQSRGFKGEDHYVTTEDGYILGIHRIVNPLTTGLKLKTIVLQHGFLGSGIDFIINSPGGYVDEVSVNGTVGNNLGFELSKRGYDVWLTNSRGNTYARNHSTLNPDKDNKYWDFSFDHHIKYDLPSTIDYVRNVTESETIAYVGHSQGSLIMFGLLSERPEYNDIVKPFVALAPISSVGHMKSPIRYMAKSFLVKSYFQFRGGAFLSSSFLNNFLTDMFCPKGFESICSNILFLLVGFNEEQLNMTRIPVYFKNTPAGSSTQNLLHWVQGVNSKEFMKYDFGRTKNRVAYGSDKPPKYHLENITSPNIALLWADNDWLADPEDIQILRNKLTVPLLDNYRVPHEKFNHLDFIWAVDGGKYVNEKILEILNKF